MDHAEVNSSRATLLVKIYPFALIASSLSAPALRRPCGSSDAEFYLVSAKARNASSRDFFRSTSGRG